MECSVKKVLFIASDNNPASGAFLCMVRLCAILKKKYNIEVKVILRKQLKHEEGVKLLEKEGIPYQWISSYNWIIEDTDRVSLVKKIKIQIKKFLKPRWGQTPLNFFYYINKERIFTYV